MARIAVEKLLFWRGKIVLDGLDPNLVDRAESTGVALICTVNLTNDGAIRPPASSARTNSIGVSLISGAQRSWIVTSGRWRDLDDVPMPRVDAI